jgi:hypothetical protein
MLLIAAMAFTDSFDAAAQRRPDRSSGPRPTSVREIPTTTRDELAENSGAAMSRTHGGVFFTINDSGNDPVVFAVDTLGRDRGAWRVPNAPNDDWEAIAVGTCGSAAAAGASCIYIGDVGDNGKRRRRNFIYRLREPAPQAPGFIGAAVAQRLEFIYPDGPHNVEAMFVLPDGTIGLITKDAHKDAQGQPRPALVFTLPASAWDGGRLNIATLADSLPIIPGSPGRRVITDAALSPDGRLLAVRTYVDVVVFAFDPTTGRVQKNPAPAWCDIRRDEQRGGEGIAWFGTSGELLLTREGRQAPMAVVRCPLPRE